MNRMNYGRNSRLSRGYAPVKPGDPPVRMNDIDRVPPKRMRQSFDPQ